MPNAALPSCFVCLANGGRKVYCRDCVDRRLGQAGKELEEARAQASVLRERLAGVLERRSMASAQAFSAIGVARRKVERLRAKVWDEEQLLEFEKAAVANTSRIHEEIRASLSQAEVLLREKEEDIVTKVLEPEMERLKAEAGIAWEELAMMRRIQVKQTLDALRVQVNDEDGQLQGMMLPRHIDSLKGGGTLQQNVAMSSLARLVSIMGSLLGITLPFQLEFLPTHCLIQGKQLTRPPNLAGDGEGGLWLEQLVLALHMLTLNARHLVRTQVTHEERGVYLMLCAQNDISPIGVLHVVVTLAKLREVGRGEPAATDYAHLEHAAFALQRQGERAAHSPTKRTIAVVGDLDGGGGAEWDFVLPPPPSETPDF